MTPLERAARRTFHSLRTRNFRLYFIGQVISGTGGWMQLFAQSWLVFRLTHDATPIGITLGLQFAPMLVIGAWAGVIVDRLDKRRLLIVTAAAAGVLALILGLITLVGAVEVWMVYVLALALGIVTVFDNPGRRAFVAEMVPAADVANAVGLNSTVFTSARIIGPAVGGMVIAGVGVSWCFLFNAVSFLAVIWALAAMDPKHLRPSIPLPRARRQLRDGLRYAWHNAPVRTALLLTAIIGMFTFNYQVVLLPLVRHEFHRGAAMVGTLLALMAIGSLVGALWVAHHSRASSRVMVMSTAAIGVTMAAAAAAPSLGVLMVVLPPVGVSTMVMVAMSTAVCQEETAPEYRGRVMALFGMAFLGSTPIGAPIVGWVSDALGARAGLWIGAITALGAGLAAFHRRDRVDVKRASTPVPTEPLVA